MNRIARTLSLAALLASAPLASARADSRTVRPGEWLITTTIEAPGMPIPRGPMTYKKCVTPEDATDPKQLVKRLQRNDECAVSNVKVEGKTVSWTLACSGSHPATGKGHITYAGDSYQGVMEVEAATARGPMKMTTRTDGKRVGECTTAPK